MNEVIPSTRPEDYPIATYYDYRVLNDLYDGILRRGITDPATYGYTLNSEKTTWSLVEGKYYPEAVVTENLPYNKAEFGRFALLPPNLRDRSKKDTFYTEQFVLPAASTEGLLSGNDRTYRTTEDVYQMLRLNTSADIVGNGEPQFMVLCAYDLSDCTEMLGTPSEKITKNGHLLTTDKAKIRNSLPALVNLHRTIFEKQASQIGYFDGLNEEKIEELLDDDKFVEVAVFSCENDEPLMFAIFGTNLSSAEQIPWLNPLAISRRLKEFGAEGEQSTSIAFPLVITAKFAGFRTFEPTVNIAMQEVINRNGLSTPTFTLFSTNLKSVLYTPRIINTQIQANQGKLMGSLIEASVTCR